MAIFIGLDEEWASAVRRAFTRIARGTRGDPQRRSTQIGWRPTCFHDLHASDPPSFVDPDGYHWWGDVPPEGWPSVRRYFVRGA